MKRIPTIVLMAFALGFTVALMTVPGCSRAASRTLTLFQLQSRKNHAGSFRIDVSKLPREAVQSRTETDEHGQRETRLELNMDYDFEIVVRLADWSKAGLQKSGETLLSNTDL